MSSLLASYRKITDQTNQGVFDNEELLLSLGRIYRGTVIDIAFGTDVVVDFIIKAGDDAIASNFIDLQSDSEEFEVQFFANPVFSAGTPITLINQLVGSTRPALASALLNPTVTDVGTPGSISVVRGIAGQGNKAGLSEGAKEALSLINPNISVLLRVTNRGVIGVLDFNARIGELLTSI